MFERVLSLFATEAYQTPVPDADAEHVLGALMVRVAKADNEYMVQELEQIDRILAQRNGFNSVDAAKFRAECEKLDAAMPDTNELAEILTRDVSAKERETMFEALWKVLLADGLRHRSEEALVGEVAQLLGLDAERAAKIAAQA